MGPAPSHMTEENVSGELIDTTEMYLRTLYELLEEGIDLRRARIVERLHQSGPTVSQTVARMERDGLLIVNPDRSIEFTDEGHEMAVTVMRKHRLAECLLTDVIGLDRALVHDEACRWEHVISDEVENRLIDILDNPTTSPYGDAIPGMGDYTAVDSAARFRTDSTPLGELLGAQDCDPRRVRVVRFTEHFQATEPNLASAQGAGIGVGAVVEVSRENGSVAVTGAKGTVELSDHDADGIFVAPAAAAR